MASFFIDFGVTFCIAFLIIFVPAELFKEKTKISLPFGFQKTAAIIAAGIAFLLTMQKHFS